MGVGLRAPPPRRQRPASLEDHEYPAGIEHHADAPTDERNEFEKTLVPVLGGAAIGRAASQHGGENKGPLQELDTENRAKPTYEEDAYVPPRAQWQQEAAPAAEYSAPPAELPGSALGVSRNNSAKSKQRMSGSYYEDVAPQFDSASEQLPMPPSIPAVGAGQYFPPPMQQGAPPAQWEPTQSPTMSTASGFTSVSQRGINPRWQEEQQQQRVGGPRQPRRNSNNIPNLNGNPDFELRPGRGNRGPGGGIR